MLSCNVIVFNLHLLLLTMFWCYVCGMGKCSYEEFRAHINRHVIDYELTRPIRCNQNSCKCTFLHTFNFFRHIRTYHASDNTDRDHLQSVVGSAVTTERSGAGNLCNDSAECINECQQATSECGINELKVEGVSLVASLRANSSIPYLVVPEVIQAFNAASNCLISACRTEAINCLITCVGNSNSDLVAKFESSWNTNVITVPI
jgi:hypothetical protein